jgi:hypothetical protein
MRAAALLFVTVLATLAACDDDPRYQVVARDLDEALLASAAPPATTCGRSAPTAGAARWSALRRRGWTRVATGTRGDLWWVAPVAGGPTYLAGKDATILRYDGATFTRMATPGLAAHTIYGLWAAAADDVWAVGSVAGRAGFVWRYDGVAWRDVPVPLDGAGGRRLRRRGRLLQGVGRRRRAAVGGRRAAARRCAGTAPRWCRSRRRPRHAVHRPPGRRPGGRGRRRHRRRARRAAPATAPSSIARRPAPA